MLPLAALKAQAVAMRSPYRGRVPMGPGRGRRPQGAEIWVVPKARMRTALGAGSAAWPVGVRYVGRRVGHNVVQRGTRAVSRDKQFSSAEVCTQIVGCSVGSSRAGARPTHAWLPVAESAAARSGAQWRAGQDYWQRAHAWRGAGASQEQPGGGVAVAPRPWPRLPAVAFSPPGCTPTDGAGAHTRPACAGHTTGQPRLAQREG